MGYEGSVVLNYRLTRKLGDGGFGEVYLAEQVDLGRLAACKILYREYASREELVARFFREAKAVCAIGHPAIIDVQNFGRLPGGEPFYLMEYFEGRDLAERIREEGPLQFHQLPAVFDPVASALSAAHAKGVIHRDLKPENIMIREEHGQVAAVKLLDFGIAKLIDTSDTGRSRTGVAMGTPTFMAPEQARDAKNVDQRADVYGFAATLFAAVIGRPPFVGESVTDIIVAVQTQRPPRMRELAPHVPPALDDIVERCLSKDPAQRPGTIEQAWGEIRATLSGETASYAAAPVYQQATLVTPAGFPAQSTLQSASAEVSSPARSSRRWWPVLVAASLALAGVAAVALALTRSSTSERPAAGPADQTDAASVAAHVAKDVDGGPGTPPSPPGETLAAQAEPPGDTIVEPDVDEVDCTEDSFTALFGQPASASDRKATVERARTCHEEGLIERALYAAVQRELGQRGQRSSERRREPRPPREPPAKPAAPPRPAERQCSTASFARVYQAPSPPSSEVNAALVRLRNCRTAGDVDADTFRNIQSALVRKL
jgi:eukaryotic-like serine/threonine-protein kinase